jgi:hypothetical protein
METLFAGKPCPLCGRTIAEGDDVFETWGFVTPEGDPCRGFCDAGIHWSCYAEWRGRERFARACFEAVLKDAAENPHFRATVLADADVLVTTNPRQGFDAIWIALAKTGTTIKVPLPEWSRFLVEPPAGLRAMEIEALEAEMPRLRALGDDTEAIVTRAVNGPLVKAESPST